jgi:hypothetical protein
MLAFLWRCFLLIFVVLRAAWVPVVMIVACSVLLFWTSQGQELHRNIHAASFTQKAGLFGAALLWSLTSWYWSRRALNEFFGRRSTWQVQVGGRPLPDLAASIAATGLRDGESLPVAQAIRLRHWQAFLIVWLPRLCAALPALFLFWMQGVDWGLSAGIAYLLSLFAARHRKKLRAFFRVERLRPYWDGVSLALALAIIILFLLYTLPLGQFFGAIGTVFLFFAAALPLFAALSYWTARWRFPTVFILLLVITLGHFFEPNRHHIRVHEPSALPDRRLALDVGLGPGTTAKPATAEVLATAQGGAMPPLGACAPIEGLPALEAWLRAQLCPSDNRPAANTNARPIPLIVVTTAGGGIRAALWTALVLGAAQDQQPVFAQRVFAISGVSGGALGATVFAASQHQSGEQAKCSSSIPPPLHQCGALAAAYEALSQDFLGPAVAAYAFNDTFGPLLSVMGFEVPSRATILETAWEDACQKAGCDRLGGAFHEALIRYRRWTPALFLNGTHIETGKRVITSPLAITPRNFDDALDFFALHEREIRVSTAALNSARFLFITPVGRLGRDDKHYGHLGDGGYFENYGAETGAEIMRAVRRFAFQYGHYIKPIVIEISSDPTLTAIDLARTTRSQRSGQEKNCDGEQVRLTLDGPLGTKCLSGKFGGLTQLTAPVTAVMEAREARGIQTARRAWYQAEQGDGIALQFSLCPFSEKELNRPPLGWTLSAETRERMRAQVATMVRDVPPSPRPEPPTEEEAAVRLCEENNWNAMQRLIKLLADR